MKLSDTLEAIETNAQCGYPTAVVDELDAYAADGDGIRCDGDGCTCESWVWGEGERP